MDKKQILEIFRKYIPVRKIVQTSDGFCLVSDDLFSVSEEKFDEFIYEIKLRHPELYYINFTVRDVNNNYEKEWNNYINFESWLRVKKSKLIPTPLHLKKTIVQFNPKKIKYVVVCHNHDPNPIPFLRAKRLKNDVLGNFSKTITKQNVLFTNLGFFINNRLYEDSINMIKKFDNIIAIDLKSHEILSDYKVKHVYIPIDLLFKEGVI